MGLFNGSFGKLFKIVPWGRRCRGSTKVLCRPPHRLCTDAIQGAQYHLNKLEKGYAVWYERILSEVIALGDDLPSTLGLEDKLSLLWVTISKGLHGS